ncbi:MAG: helix-turn-helix transcriptional regulator [Clostridiales bacterium]|jgi:AraC-like DNA-binding protein|nr:helix-turn-helix transcriptional regulator [Clostridiales bacterium]
MIGRFESSHNNDVRPLLFDTNGCSAHFHANIEIVCVKRGAIEIVINGSRRVLRGGEVSVSGPFDIHQYALIEPDSVGRVLIIPLTYAAKFGALTSKKVLEDYFFGGAAFNEIETLFGVLERHIDGDDLTTEGIIDAVLGIVLKNLPFGRAKSVKMEKDVMRDCLTYINANYREEISLEGLAKEFGYSPNHFSKLFNTYLQTGLREYVNTLRADDAAALIRGGADVSAAAFDSGFDCMRTFYRVFKTRFCMTPREYVNRREALLEQAAPDPSVERDLGCCGS